MQPQTLDSRVLPAADYNAILLLARSTLPCTTQKFHDWLDRLSPPDRICTTCLAGEGVCERSKDRLICQTCAHKRKRCSLVDRYKIEYGREKWGLTEAEFQAAVAKNATMSASRTTMSPLKRGRPARGTKEPGVLATQPTKSSVQTRSSKKAPPVVSVSASTATSSKVALESEDSDVGSNDSVPAAHRSPKKRRRGNSSIANSLTDEVADLRAQLQAAMEENSQLRMRVEDSEDQLSLINEANREMVEQMTLDKVVTQLLRLTPESDLRQVPIPSLSSFILKDLSTWVATRSLLRDVAVGKDGSGLVSASSLLTLQNLTGERIDFLHEWIVSLQPALSVALKDATLVGVPPSDIESLNSIAKAALQERDRLVNLEREDQLRERREREEAERKQKEEENRQRRVLELRAEMEEFEAKKRRLAAEMAVLENPLSMHRVMETSRQRDVVADGSSTEAGLMETVVSKGEGVPGPQTKAEKLRVGDLGQVER